MTLGIASDFESGAIEIRALGDDWADLTLRGECEGFGPQWFHFRVDDAAGRRIRLRLLNAAAATYPQAWPDYRAWIRPDGEAWRRADTSFNGRELEVSVAAGDRFWVAYFVPYELAKLDQLLARAAATPGWRVREVARSVEGRRVEVVSLGGGPRQVWVLARQHPGETMASWWAEGALERLMDPADPTVGALLARATIHVAPLVNVDGVVCGHMRGNAAGVDLNRQWDTPDPVQAPEVAGLLRAMIETGVDVCLDVHGDESLPHVFSAGCDLDPEASVAQIEGVARFTKALSAANPAFQTTVGYGAPPPGAAAQGICVLAVGRRFGAIAVTLEMPFKDSLDAPEPALGWSPERSQQLGRDCVDALLAALPADAV